MMNPHIAYRISLIAILLVTALAGALLTFVLIAPALAVDSSGSAIASPSASLSPTLTDKINAIKVEIASKAAKLKTEVNKKMQNKVNVGSVSQVQSDKIILSTRTGPKTVLINEYTIYGSDDPKFKKFSFKNVEVGDNVAALGDVDDNKMMTAKKVQLLPVAKPINPQSFWGKVQSAAGNTINLEKSDHTMGSLYTSEKTNYLMGGVEGSFIDVKINHYLAGMGKLNSNNEHSSSSNNLVADFIYLIPSGATLKPAKKLASPSASIKAIASSSAKPQNK